jgi:hypothetical protein
MKKISLIAILIGSCFSSFAQELFVFTEPASNMPAHTISTKLSANFGEQRNYYSGIEQRYTPEIMFGISKKLMIHTVATFSNMNAKNTGWEAVYLYGKYRFLSKDDVHQHFRMAAFAEGTYSWNKSFTDELNLSGDRSGIQTGVIATQLINKLAFSATAGYVHALDKKKYEGYSNVNLPYNAFNYSLSSGVLLLPKEYKTYNQLNLNFYTELLGQQTLDKKSFYVDLAPSIQFIFNSNSKLNLGYRFQLNGNQVRNMEKYFLISFEHTFFNALKK